MEQFTEEHSKCLLAKEWLVKTHNHTSTPYLFKFHSSTIDLSCCVLVTDTKSLWVEVLTSNQLARRWRECQPTSAPSLMQKEEEEAWRTTTLELLSRAHTIGGITDASFDIVSSTYSDLAFEFEWESFKWRWETCALGYRASADLISKHLIYPLISISHFAFSSPEAINSMSDTDIEKVTDKAGRTARRTVDVFIKNAMSKPRLASTLRRMTAMFNSISDLPPVISLSESPDLVVEHPIAKPPTCSFHAPSRPISPHPRDRNLHSQVPSVEPAAMSNPQGDTGSATESDDGEGGSGAFLPKGARNIQPTRSPTNSQQPDTKAGTPTHDTTSRPVVLPSDSDSSPVRPPKKQKTKAVESSSDEDSEAERRKRIAALKSGSGNAGDRKGTKQPIKRGGKRF